MSVRIGPKQHSPAVHDHGEGETKIDRATTKKRAEASEELPGTEEADVEVDFTEWDRAGETDLFAAVASTHARKRAMYVPPEIQNQATNWRDSFPAQKEGSLKQTLEKVAKRLSTLPPPPGRSSKKA